MNHIIADIQDTLNANGYPCGPADGIAGPLTTAAWLALCEADKQARMAAPASAEWAGAASAQIQGTLLVRDGSWPWQAVIDGADIVILGARATCFGGFDDPQDNGETASGVSTKTPGILGCSLPMDTRGMHGLSQGEHDALDGSPIPWLPWETQVEITAFGQTHKFPLLDAGPAKKTGNAVDLTRAAARLFVPNATETNFAMGCGVRIIGGAKFVKS